MVILAFDTAMAACSVALWRDGVTLAARREVRERGHAERLMVLVTEVLAAGDMRMDGVARLAVTVGPGSFTGVRVGLAAARGLALPRDIPVMGFTTGEILAAGARASHPDVGVIISAVDTKRGDLYVEAFGADSARLLDAATMTAADVAAWVARQGAEAAVAVVGDGAIQFADDRRFRMLADAIYPDPVVMAARAAARAPAAEPPSPLYVQPPKVTLAGAAR